jgi:protein-disulfide isomerase
MPKIYIMTIRITYMRRLFLSLLAASAFTLTPALAQQAPDSIAAIPQDDGYAFLEAPNDHIIGSDTAPNTLIIYASVTCPHCSSWFTGEWDLLKSELIDTGDLRVVFREFVTAPSQVAVTGFTLANCTKNDNYIDVIYHEMAEQANIMSGLQAGKGIEVYASTLEVAGLTPEDLEACFADQSHFQRLETSMARAANGNLQGVPSFILNGELYKGNVTAQDLSERFAAGVSTP